MGDGQAMPKQLLAGEAQEARRRVRVPGWQEGGTFCQSNHTRQP